MSPDEPLLRILEDHIDTFKNLQQKGNEEAINSAGVLDSFFPLHDAIVKSSSSKVLNSKDSVVLCTSITGSSAAVVIEPLAAPLSNQKNPNPSMSQSSAATFLLTPAYSSNGIFQERWNQVIFVTSRKNCRHQWIIFSNSISIPPAYFTSLSIGYC